MLRGNEQPFPGDDYQYRYDELDDVWLLADEEPAGDELDDCDDDERDELEGEGDDDGEGDELDEDDKDDELLLEDELLTSFCCTVKLQL